MGRRQSRLQKLGRQLGVARLGFGAPPRRSRRLEMYAAAAGMPSTSNTLALQSDRVLSWLRNRWSPLVLSLLLALAVYVLFGTSWFYIYDIEAEGLRLTSKEELYNRSNLEALSIFWLRPSTVEKRLEEDPIIADAKVSFVPPANVRVRVEERQPMAVWQTGDQNLFVDGEGVLFGLRGDARGMLVIRDLSGTPAEMGSKVDPQVVRSAQELAQRVPGRMAFDWEPGLGLSFVTDGGWRVAFGDHTRLDVKVASFHAFQSQIQPEKKVLFLDLSVPEHPYYRTEP
ncbi:MAG TPA: FtsQ-type POTRA domain-containing protein [Ardenticatenaceae bacterium]